MGRGGEHWGWPPAGAPLRDDHWTHFDSTVNAVSFGFVATAVLISMFLAMAIFERFLRTTTSPPSSPSGRRRRYRRDIESQIGFSGKPHHLPSPKISTNAREVSVLMPGDGIPTFIAHPAPVPCPPERIPWSAQQQKLLPGIIQQYSNSDTSSSSI